MNVFLIDDDSDLRMLYRRLLELTDSNIHIIGEADNARDGVIQCSAYTPDIILMDISMPGMKAADAIPLIKHAAPGSKLVILSSYQRELFEDEMLGAGADAYLEKGIATKDLIKFCYAITEEPARIAV